MTSRLFPLLLLLGVLLAGCGANASPAALIEGPAGTAVPTPASDTPSLQISFRGGRCVYGLCSRTAIFGQDGSLLIADGSGATTEAHLTPAEQTELITQLAQADVAAIKARPFTDTCPTAYDGQEITFTIATASGPEIFPSCTFALDTESAPFSTALALLAKYNI